jgi:hypothetical protein
MNIHQYKMKVNKIQISKGSNTKCEKICECVICECVNEVFLKHGLEERIHLEERNGFPILKLWWYMLC